MLAAETLSAVDEFNARATREQWRTQCDDKLIFDSPKLAQLRDIWQMVRGPREIPRRTDFTARILGKHLQNLTFVERVQSDGTHRYRFRMYGSTLARYLGDCTGKYLDEAVPKSFSVVWFATYDTVIAARRPLRFMARFRAGELEHIAAECFVSPVAADDGSPWGLLVSVIYSPVVV
jgi:hypothetical protein